MRMRNGLVVRGDPAEVAKLVERLEDAAPEGWKRDPESEERLKAMRVFPWGAYCFSWRGDAVRPAASLILHRQGLAELSVMNIVAKERRSLSDEEYNDILLEFEQDVLRPNIAGIRVETSIIPPVVGLEASLSTEALRRLKAFSSNANKAAPHPDDWRRWDQFLVQVHHDGSFLDDVELAMWLGNDGWTESQSAPFIDRFNVSQSLLATYDEERSAS